MQEKGESVSCSYRALADASIWIGLEMPSKDLRELVFVQDWNVLTTMIFFAVMSLLFRRPIISLELWASIELDELHLECKKMENSVLCNNSFCT